MKCKHRFGMIYVVYIPILRMLCNLWNTDIGGSITMLHQITAVSSLATDRTCPLPYLLCNIG